MSLSPPATMSFLTFSSLTIIILNDFIRTDIKLSLFLASRLILCYFYTEHRRPFYEHSSTDSQSSVLDELRRKKVKETPHANGRSSSGTERHTREGNSLRAHNRISVVRTNIYILVFCKKNSLSVDLSNISTVKI